MTTPAPPAPTLPALDHASFPHIFDAIIKHASCSDLGTMRCTSTHVQKLAELELGARIRHLALGNSDDLHSTMAIPHSFTLHCSTGCRGPCRQDRYPLPPRNSSLSKRLVHQVRTVDVNPRTTTASIEQLSNDLSCAEIELEIVRLSLGHSPRHSLSHEVLLPLVAKTYILFVIACGAKGIPIQPWPLLPVGVRKVVICVQFPVGRRWMWHRGTLFVNLPLPFTVKEVVVIFRPRSAYVEDNQAAVSTEITLGDLVNNLVTAMSDNTPTVSYTLVGVHNVPPSALGLLGPSPKGLGYASSLIARVAENKEMWGHAASEIDKATSMIRFCTSEEYRAEVGDKQFMIETTS